jgi:peptidoglycan hydrolase-like protein with peptidoglycan-binding domain
MQNQSNFETSQRAFSGDRTRTANSPEDIRRMQRALNRSLGLRLPVDGAMSFRTRRAIRDFQRRKGLPADGIVRLATERALFNTRSAKPFNEFELVDFADLEEREIPPAVQPPIYNHAAYYDVIEKIRVQLERRFSSPNDPLLLERRKELLRLFNLVPAVFAKTLYNQLQSRTDSLSRLLTGRLAPITRTVMLRVLQSKIASLPKLPNGQAPPKPSAAHSDVLNSVANGKRLPAALEPEFLNAVNRFVSFLRENINNGKLKDQKQAEKLICFLLSLTGTNSNDRVIFWTTRCPMNILMRSPIRVCSEKRLDFEERFLTGYRSSQFAMRIVDDRNLGDMSTFINHLKPIFLNIHLVIPNNDNVDFLYKSLVNISNEIEHALDRVKNIFEKTPADEMKNFHPVLRNIKNQFEIWKKNANSIYFCLK